MEQEDAGPPLERPAEDLAEIYAKASELRALVEARVERWMGEKEERLRGWGRKLETFAQRIERALEEVDERTDEVAGRFPRDPQPPERRSSSYFDAP